MRLALVAFVSLCACKHAAATTPAPPADALDPELTTFAYPFPVSRLGLRAQEQDLSLAYMDVPAAKPNGRTVVLLHGKNFSGAYWEPTVRALHDRGFRVVVPDQIGFGKSSKPRAFQFTFHALADHTRQLLDALHLERVSVVGHSMGGMVATRFALSYPTRVEKLALVNPIGLEDWQRVVPYRPIEAWYRDELALTPEKIRDYQSKSYYAGGWSDAADKLMQIQARWTKHPEYPRVAWCSALTYDMIFTQPVVHELADLRAPTLLIIGQRDRTALGKASVSKEVAATLGDYPTLGRKAAAAIPGAKLVELEGVGHVPQLEAFDKYRDALVSFLE
jgi:pimeloyl-ACP methyl ester carboxylesterase